MMIRRMRCLLCRWLESAAKPTRPTSASSQTHQVKGLTFKSKRKRKRKTTWVHWRWRGLNLRLIHNCLRISRLLEVRAPSQTWLLPYQANYLSNSSSNSSICFRVYCNNSCNSSRVKSALSTWLRWAFSCQCSTQVSALTCLIRPTIWVAWHNNN